MVPLIIDFLSHPLKVQHRAKLRMQKQEKIRFSNRGISYVTVRRNFFSFSSKLRGEKLDLQLLKSETTRNLLDSSPQSLINYIFYLSHIFGRLPTCEENVNHRTRIEIFIGETTFEVKFCGSVLSEIWTRAWKHLVWKFSGDLWTTVGGKFGYEVCRVDVQGGFWMKPWCRSKLGQLIHEVHSSVLGVCSDASEVLIE